MAGNSNNSETAQLDHDYCTNQQHEKAQGRDEPSRSADWEKKWGDSKKDSGLESGDVSDASETHERARNKPSASNAVPFASEVTNKVNYMILKLYRV